MTTTTARKGRISAKAVGLKAVGDPAAGVFEAIVAVFGNVDHQGDRIKAGAFATSLAEWSASGDPIPVVFSHQWGDLDAHVGEVLDAKELLPGDPMLAGTGLEANGGLWTKFALFVEGDHELAAKRLATRLTKRTIREFSFAYDVISEERAPDGVNDLLELGVIEVGPTLKGANPATVLLGKTLGEGWEALTEEQVLDALAKAIAGRPAPATADGEKANVAVTFAGSVESEIDELYTAGRAWAMGLDVGNGGFYWLHQEATYPAELRSIVLVEGWDDPYGEGIFYELSFERAEDGSLAVKEARELVVEVTTTPKARAWKHRSAPRAKSGATVPGADDPGKGKAKGETPEEPEPRTGSEADHDEGLSPVDELDLALMGAGLDPTDPT